MTNLPRRKEQRHPRDGEGGRPEIRLGGNLAPIVDLAIEALAGRDVYQRHGALVDVVHDAEEKDGMVRPEGLPRIRIIPHQRLREQLEQSATWLRKKRTDDGTRWVNAPVPSDVVAAVDARGEWSHLRLLDGVVESPVFCPDGSVLCTRGYDPRTRLICSSSVAVEVPDRPTHDDARRAVDALLDVVADFPFVKLAHRSAWLAALLTVVGRPAIDGPVPLTLFDAANRGTGKTLLADIIGAIVTGRRLPRRTAPDEPSEWRKAMLAIAIAADSCILIDNVTRMLRADALDAVLTGTVFRDRILGKNQELSLPIQTVFFVTMNNATLSGDLVRRSQQIRLEARDEHPEQRNGFRHEPLFPWVLSNRKRLLAAALTILRAYHVAGRPVVNLRTMGSYDSWSAVVRAAIVWVGEVDPALTQDDLRETADTDREAELELLQAWHAHYGERATTTGNVLRDVSEDKGTHELRAAIELICDGKSNARNLGYKLRQLRGRRIGGFVVDRASSDDRQGGARWIIRRPDAGDAGDAGDVLITSRERSSEEHADRIANPHRRHDQQKRGGGSVAGGNPMGYNGSHGDR